MVVFACVLAVNQLGRLSFGAQAPMMAAAPAFGIGGGEGEPEPAMESQAEDSSLAVTPTPEMLLMTVPEATAAPENRIIQPEDEVAAKINPSPNTWIFLWPALAAVCTGIALLLRWISIRQFRRKNIK